MPYYIQSRCFEIGPTVSAWERFKNVLVFINDNLLGIIFLFFLMFFIVIWIPNYITLIKYKRERRGNDKKFTTKRCIEDGDEAHRHHVYLINEADKTYRRIADTYTLNKLGYGSASRNKESCFSVKDYTIKRRIKIYNLLTSIRTVWGLKNDIS